MESGVIVQKFGGTSVSTPDRRAHVIEHVRRARHAGYSVALVVSAMGRRGDPYATDTLLDLLRGDGGPVDAADYNSVFVTGELISVAVVSHALKRAGIRSVPLSGFQAGIYAGGHPLEAEVVDIDLGRIRGHLLRGEVPVVTGGQAVFRDSLDFATLGRGASDTSGVVLGVALGAERVEIFTDVTGVATADPRVVPQARWVRRVSYRSMHELARFGAKVVHPRAISAGWKARTPLVVRSTFSSDPGTLIADIEDEAPILGLAALSPMDTRVVTAAGVGDDQVRDWERHRLVMTLAGQSPGTLVLGTPADRSAELDRVIQEAGVRVLTRFPPAAWLSIVGAARALDERRHRDELTLGKKGIDIHVTERTENRTTLVLPATDLERATLAMHDDVFGEVA